MKTRRNYMLLFALLAAIMTIMSGCWLLLPATTTPEPAAAPAPEPTPPPPPPKGEVVSIAINPSYQTSMWRGTSKKFIATVEVTGDISKDVIWSISGNTAADTTIDQDGTLFISKAEKSSTIVIVTATSVADRTKSITCKVIL